MCALLQGAQTAREGMPSILQSTPRTPQQQQRQQQQLQEEEAAEGRLELWLAQGS
jgi:hypothetical protein